MPLHRLIRRLFPKFEPQTTTLRSLGEAQSDRYGCWTVQQPVGVAGNQVGVCFKADIPGEREVAHYQEVAANWPTVWMSIIAGLRKDLEDDGVDEERETFIANTGPSVLYFSDGLELWEVVLKGDIYQGHMVTVMMKGFDCQLVRLDG